MLALMRFGRQASAKSCSCGQSAHAAWRAASPQKQAPVACSKVQLPSRVTTAARWLSTQQRSTGQGSPLHAVQCCGEPRQCIYRISSPACFELRTGCDSLLQAPHTLRGAQRWQTPSQPRSPGCGMRLTEWRPLSLRTPASALQWQQLQWLEAQPTTRGEAAAAWAACCVPEICWA